MSTLLISLSVLQFAFVAGFAVKRQKLIQATPSLVWFALMTLPFIYQFHFFPNGPRVNQSIGLFLISSALTLGDLFSIKNKCDEMPSNKNFVFTNSKMIYLLIFLVVIVPIFHYWRAGTIPIIDEYFAGKTKSEIALERENFGKLLDLPYLFKVLVNWIYNLFGPILIIWLIVIRKYWLASVLFVWVLFYAFASSADGPVIFFLWSFIIGLVCNFYHKKNLGNWLTIGISLGLIFTILSGILIGSAAIHNSSQCLKSVPLDYSPGDILRSCSEKNIISINPVVDRLGYRYFLTPVEVSNRWYDYFDGSPAPSRNFDNIFERDVSNQASNKVGKWAYVSKFPDKYADTISANTSIDADANSFAGIPSVIIVAILLLLIRTFVGFSTKNSSVLERVLEGIAIGQLSFFPVTAPLQAMLLPQGLGLILLLLLVLRGKSLWFAVKSKFN